MNSFHLDILHQADEDGRFASFRFDSDSGQKTIRPLSWRRPPVRIVFWPA